MITADRTTWRYFTFVLGLDILPVLSELQRMVSFSWAPGPCLIQTEMVKGSFVLVRTRPSGTLMAWVPLNSNTWSLSCPLSVGRPTVQLAELLGAGRSSTVPELAPEEQNAKQGIVIKQVKYSEQFFLCADPSVFLFQYVQLYDFHWDVCVT